MTDDISPIELPRGTVTITPTALDYVYLRANGNDVISVVIQDRRVGSIQVLLTPGAAQHVSAHLAGMVGQLDELRAQWNERNTND